MQPDTTLKSRMYEVAADRGEKPTNRYFERLFGLSSGRIAQLFKEGSTGKLGADALARVVSLGYSPEWVIEGKGEKLLSTPMQQPADNKALSTTQEEELLVNFRKLDSTSRRRCLIELRYRADLAELDGPSDKPIKPQSNDESNSIFGPPPKKDRRFA